MPKYMVMYKVDVHHSFNCQTEKIICKLLMHLIFIWLTHESSCVGLF